MDGNDSEELLKKADTAMYRAKDLGRGRFVYFEEQMNIEAIERVNLEREMRQGLLHKEFILHYQPKIDLRTGQITGAEALVRWNHPTRGLVYPGVFIGIAEDIRLIDEIGRNVIWDACAQHATWRSEGVNAPPIAVNISGRQFQSGNLIQIIKDALQTTSTPPSALEIEVTESLFMDETSDAIAVLHELRQMGIKVAIDDFGTGYSSMSYLRLLPIDYIKIDMSFITDMINDSNSRTIVEVIITLAHKLHKIVIAEGVETLDQLNLLRSWQCDIIQGYYFSKPLTPEQFVVFMQEPRLS
jgi:EAL domain-containing protein (putative c-di-GMP-specific phosphodiesterase class I)